MLISVIVPVYNVEMYLRQCLDSILAQTYKELEVVMVDDGSTDSCGDICEEYAAKYENFRVVHKKNAGLGMARNTGLEHITGEYVVFVDSDDYMDPTCIETLYNNLIKHGVDMCKSGYRRVTDKRKIIETWQCPDEVFAGVLAKDKLLPRMLGSSPEKKDSEIPSAWGAIYRIEPIKKYNLRFPSERELIFEDLAFQVDFMQYANGASTISYIGYNYRCNTGSLMESYRKDRFEAIKHFHIVVRKKLKELGYDNSVLQRFQRLFFVHLRMCLAQEKQAISGLDKKSCLKNISKICEDEVVRDTIANYPVNKMGIQQAAFLRLIQLKAVRTLRFLIEKGVV